MGAVVVTAGDDVGEEGAATAVPPSSAVNWGAGIFAVEGAETALICHGRIIVVERSRQSAPLLASAKRSSAVSGHEPRKLLALGVSGVASNSPVKAGAPCVPSALAGMTICVQALQSAGMATEPSLL